MIGVLLRFLKRTLEGVVPLRETLMQISTLRMILGGTVP
jgi:hypothetical protein